MLAFPKDIKSLRAASKQPLSQAYTPHHLLQIVGGPFPDAECSENQSQQAILWTHLMAEEKRNLPQFVWPALSWSTTEHLCTGKGLYRDHTEDFHLFSQAPVLLCHLQKGGDLTSPETKQGCWEHKLWHLPGVMAPV